MSTWTLTGCDFCPILHLPLSQHVYFPLHTLSTCVFSTSHTFYFTCTFTQGDSYTCEHVDTHTCAHTHMCTHRISNVFSKLLCTFRLEPLGPGPQAWLLNQSRERRERGHDASESGIALWDHLPSWEALGITCASVQTLWEALFPLKLTSWDSISAILVPMWAVLSLGGQWLKPCFLPSLPSPPWGVSVGESLLPRVPRRLPGVSQLLPRLTKRGHEARSRSQRGLTLRAQPSAATLGWSLHNWQ